MYGTVEEFSSRQEIFDNTDNYVRSVNENPESTHKAGHNKFSDWTWEEYNGLLGLKDMPKTEFEIDFEEEEEVANLPSTWDWRSSGKVTPVKDQGQCGSCWAFSAVEAIESAWMIAGNAEAIMSPQELVDCSSSTGNEGCNGGWYFWAYDWLKTNMIESESDYPYTATDDACAYDATKGITSVASDTRVVGRSANLNAIYKQPVNVAVAAGNNVFRNYSSGVVTINDDCPTAIDHAIVAVGWGIDMGTEYYIVRNSWGSSWGQDGYIYLATSGGPKGVCGINQYVYYPNL